MFLVAGCTRKIKWLFKVIMIVITIIDSFSLAKTKRNTVKAKYSDLYFAYKVRRGESLSGILFKKMKLNPSQGKRSFLKTVLLNNRGKILKHGDLILAGEIIFIPLDQKRIKAIPEVNPVFHVGNVPDKPKAPEPELESYSNGNFPNSKRTSASEETQGAIGSSSGPRNVVSESIPNSDRPVEVANNILQNVSNSGGDEVQRRSTFPDSDFRVESKLGLRYLGLFGVERENQSKGRLVTDLNPSFDFSWLQIWDRDFSSRVYFGGEYVRFTLEQAGLRLIHPNVFNTRMGMSFFQTLGYRWMGIAEVSFEQVMFYTSLNRTEIEIDQLPIFKFSPQIQKILAKKGPFELLIGGGVSYYGASFFNNYSVKSGYGVDGSVALSQQFKNVKLSCKLLYGERRQSSTYLDLIEKALGSTCGLFW